MLSQKKWELLFSSEKKKSFKFYNKITQTKERNFDWKKEKEKKLTRRFV